MTPPIRDNIARNTYLNIASVFKLYNPRTAIALIERLK
ncbi:hypothetical protein BME20236_II0869 [Brucella melitensis]|uniref:Uncharacterized protein n=1 Tax=Brucella melitensis biotype 2 (strain ATCC 23457) TaxID=546272 RepID=C0RM92_BRUMB|nr:Hypothetical protein, conserved [Brucella melitensis ATCC 23457]ADZ68167.1 conserved hypothetical protein [Brucella melitensis M28]ADZ89033.1 conserved hypothetical protein [Brucella melitensis M5-90]AEQ10597.1 hypothetical protein BMNI_II0887 [Brucella melitensis NI]AIJ94360.1 hypothetical protein DK61_2276 [Brucella melitensis bv. 2 str. 63/9]ALM36361.1 hypothetical protein BME20236_II0869 [Brucella melitensis]ENQ62667.1 hypothetical protein C045_02424 [Brucella melitensis 64/150]ENQ656